MLTTRSIFTNLWALCETWISSRLSYCVLSFTLSWIIENGEKWWKKDSYQIKNDLFSREDIWRIFLLICHIFPSSANGFPTDFHSLNSTTLNVYFENLFQKIWLGWSWRAIYNNRFIGNIPTHFSIKMHTYLAGPSDGQFFSPHNHKWISK